MEPGSMASPHVRARTAGIFYLLNILTGMVAAFAGGRLAAYGDFANLLATLFYVVVTLLFYDVFRPVNKPLSLLAACFSLAGCAISAHALFHLAHSPVGPLAFFGVYCLLIGYLVVRSTFLPPILGVLMAFGGLGWLTFLSPSLASHLSPYNLLPGIIGEGTLTVWLLAKGVNAQRWNQQAGAPTTLRTKVESP